jgi:hypothetical protein
MLAGLIVVALAVLIWPIVSRERRMARFWACGMLLSIIPVCATFPSNRLLLFVGLGGMGLLAMFLQAVFDRTAPRRSRWVRWPAYALVGIHLVIAPVGLALTAAFPTGPKALNDRLYVRTPLDESVANQDVIVVNAPSTAHAMYMPVMRALDGKPVPRRMRVLAPAVPSVEVRRLDDRTLAIRPADGYIGFAFDKLFRDERHPLNLGEQIQIAGMQVHITDLMEDGRPAEAQFRFDEPLEDSSFRWLQYKNGEFVPFTPPAVGKRIVLKASWLRG